MPTRRSRRSYGYSLLEIMVVLAIIGMIAGITALSLFKFIPEARIKTTREGAQVIRRAVSLYRMDHGAECPTVPQLVEMQLIDQASKTTDAWDVAFTVDCNEQGAVNVISSGPDKRMNTADDIRVPLPPAAVATAPAAE
jgi:prepilin-type N-terminal cleavage/methylation domain-containing protein